MRRCFEVEVTEEKSVAENGIELAGVDAGAKVRQLLGPVSIGTSEFILDSQALDSYPEPTAVVDDLGVLIAANRPFQKDSGLTVSNGARLGASAMHALAEAIARKHRVRCSVDGEVGARVYDVMAFPLSNPHLWLLIANETTVEIGLRNALIDSRARYMDLVSLSGESAWETAEDGTFSIITSKGLAGFDAKQLVGRNPVDLLDRSMALPPVLPFSTPIALTDIYLWLIDANGNSVCFEVSAVPLYDADGIWRGARGICRDVTEDRQNASFLAELRNHERLFWHITSIFRSTSNPDDMMRVAAEASAQGMGASGCQIFTAHLPLTATVPQLELIVSFGECLSAEAIEGDLTALVADADSKAKLIQLDGWSLLAAPAIYGGKMIGAIVLWRRVEETLWSLRDEQLLEAISAQLAAAIEQRTQFHKLLAASMTDPLTGLFNRRAFDDEIQRRFQRLQLDGASSALVYVDLDNFKQVNDVHGHDAGDEALRHVADILRSNTRSIDLVARLGGDEFAVWLDNADQDVASKRATIFLVAAKSLLSYSGSKESPLKMSIGVAVYDPASKEPLTDFIHRADAAMYQVKRSGKGAFAVAPPATTGASLK